MKKGTLLVVRKPYQGDTVIQNTLNYAIGSLFADEEDILTSYIVNGDDSDQIIEEYYRLQAPYNMTDHRRMFHFILTTRTSKFAGLFFIHWVSGCHGSAFRQLQRFVKLSLSCIAQSHFCHRLSHSRQISDLSGYCELSESIHAHPMGLEISFRSLILHKKT